MSSSSRKRGESRVARIDNVHHKSSDVPMASPPESDVLSAVAGFATAAKTPPQPESPSDQDGIRGVSPELMNAARRRGRRQDDTPSSSPLSTAEPTPSVSLESGPEDRAARIGLNQIERHARELGQQLHDQQRSLDRRQAEFNAKLARIETELRAARMQHRDRETELSERETDFQLRWQLLQGRTTDVDDAEMALNAEVHEDRLTKTCNHEQIRDALERWKGRLTELDKSELQLQAQLAEVAAERDRLSQRQTKIDADRESLQQERDSLESLSKNDLATRQQDIRKQTEQVEHRKQSLEKLHAEVARMYREALELRICTEQLWGQLSEKASPAELTTRVSEFRRKLTEQYQQANQSLTDQRHEIGELIKRLESQHDAVGQQRDRLQNWLLRRQAEIERQAARLIAREQELDKHQSKVQSLEHHWDEQRRQYEQTIGELRRQIADTNRSPFAGK